MKAKMGLLLFVVLVGAGAAYGSRVDKVDATPASPLFARSLDQAIAKFDGRAPTIRMRSAKRARYTAVTPTFDSAPTCLAAPTCSVSCGAPTCDAAATCLAAPTCTACLPTLNVGDTCLQACGVPTVETPTCVITCNGDFWCIQTLSGPA